MTAELHKLTIDKQRKARRNDRSYWPWILLLLLLAGGGALGYNAYKKAHSVTEVKVLRVTLPPGVVPEEKLVVLNASGYLMAAHRVELASKVVGRVAWVGVEMGDRVQANQVLVRLEDDEYKARVAQEQGQLNAAKARLAELKAGPRSQEIAQAQAQLESAIASAENARRNYDRMSKQASTTSISQQEIDDALTLAKTREAQVEINRQQLELLKAGTRSEQIAAQEATVSQLEGALAMSMVDFNNTVIRAPVASTILERNVEVGEFVTTGFVGDRGAKGYVVSIADLNDLLVELDVSQEDFAKVALNQPCWITTDAYPDRRYAGTVQLISPVANRQKATIQVRVRVTSPDELLKPDMNASVAFLSAEMAAATRAAATQPHSGPTAIQVPATAIVDGTVFVVDQGKASRRTIVAGATADGMTDIRKGLKGGEEVIIAPPPSLKDGDAVTIRN